MLPRNTRGRKQKKGIWIKIWNEMFGMPHWEL